MVRLFEIVKYRFKKFFRFKILTTTILLSNLYIIFDFYLLNIIS